MNPIYAPLLSALAGAVIGSLSSIVTILIQARIGERRERIRQAMTLALEDRKLQVANASPGTGIMPMSLFLHNQLAVLEALEQNDLTPERLRKIAANDTALMEVMLELDRQFRKQAAVKV
jgi:hypothetical protein